MQAPQSPVDIKVTLGSQQNCQNLINLDVDVTDNKQQVKQHLEQRKITTDFGKDLILFFDLYVEAGRQKQAVQYFKDLEGKSPLQIVFKSRPGEQDQAVKFQIQEHQGYVRLFYRFIVPEQDQQIQQINTVFSIFKTNGLQLQSHMNFDLKGIVSHNKKNRTNVKVDYAKFQFVSNVFNSECLLNSLTSLQGFASDLQELVSNPFWELIKKSKIAKVNIKMDSFRKISKFYNQVNEQNKQPQTKQFKYVNKGIFRIRADATMVYNNQYMVKVNGKYESEDVFIRLIKVYSKFFEQILDTMFYDDD